MSSSMGVATYRARSEGIRPRRKATAEWRVERCSILVEKPDRRTVIFQGLEEIDAIINSEKIQPGEVQLLTSLPKLPQTPLVPQSSIPLRARASKFRRACGPSACDSSCLPEMRQKRQTHDALARQSSLGRQSHFDQGRALALPPRSKVGPREKMHVYKSLRLFIFCRGKVGTQRDKLRCFLEQRGTQKQHLEFYEFWIQADPDMFGEVAFSDFEALLNNHHLHGQKITSLLLNRETGQVMIDDVIEALWPDIGPEESSELLEHMEVEQQKRRRVAVDEPPLLPAEDRVALERIFLDLDTLQTGYVSFEALAAARDDCGLPILDASRLRHYAAEWNILWGPLGKDNVEEVRGSCRGSLCRDGHRSREKSVSSERGRNSTSVGACPREEIKSIVSLRRCDRSNLKDRFSKPSVSEGITLKSFLLMMCPAGFRAFEGARVTTDQTGDVLIRSNSGIWRAA